MEHPWRTTNTVSEVRHGCFINFCECTTAKWVLRHPHFHTMLHLCPRPFAPPLLGEGRPPRAVSAAPAGPAASGNRLASSPPPSCVHHPSDCPVTVTACPGGGGRQPSVGHPAGLRRRHPPAGRFPSPLMCVPPICVPSHRDRLVTCVPLLSGPASSDCLMHQGHLRHLRLALLACIHRLGTEEGRGKALTANQNQQEDTEE